MLKFFWKKRRRGEGGFTLIELVVVLAILGILIALAVPRYLGARKNAIVAEGDNTLQEMKTLAWAYYQQYSDFTGITVTNVGFVAPATACWTFDYTTKGVASVTMRALANRTGRTQCTVLSGSETIDLILNNDGSSSRTQSL